MPPPKASDDTNNEQGNNQGENFAKALPGACLWRSVGNAARDMNDSLRGRWELLCRKGRSQLDKPQRGRALFVVLSGINSCTPIH